MDFVALSTALSGVVTSAITAAVPIITIVLGASIGYRMYKRFTK